MNLQELRTRTRKHLAEAGSGLHADPDIDSQLNRSARSIAAERALLKRRATITTDEDGVMLLPTDAVAVTEVYSAQHRTHLMAINPADAPMEGTGISYGPAPLYYSHDPAWGAAGQVYPPRVVTLTVNLLTGGLKMSELTDEPWNGAYEDYHDVIALHAAHMLSGQGGPSAAREAIYLQRYQSRMDEFKSAIAMQQLDQPALRIAGVAPGPRRRWRGL